MPRRTFPLPDELLLQILALLPPPALLAASHTCAQLYELSFDPALHRPHLGDRSAPHPEYASLRELHIRNHGRLLRGPRGGRSRREWALFWLFLCPRDPCALQA